MHEFADVIPYYWTYFNCTTLPLVSVGH